MGLKLEQNLREPAPRSRKVERRRRFRKRFLRALGEYGALVAVVAVAAVFTGLNIFDFPNYENDEGTYMGSAWAMFHQGKLSYYTYTYDHPVLGWFLLGIWTELVGGFLDFGMSVNTGRVLMLIVAILSAALIFLIVLRATGRTVAALPAAVIFAVSPLGVSLHRQVWIDNIATLFLLVSLYALVSARGRLTHMAVSSLAFGLAFWAKEVFVVFLPGMFYLAFVQAHLVNRHFAVVLWGVVSTSIISGFMLLAVLKGELLPPGVLWSSSEPHVSLIGTYLYQASRGGSDGLLNPEGEFWRFFGQWRYNDPLLVFGGLIAAGVGFLLWRRDRILFGLSVMTFMFFLFIGRGGVVLYYYVIPLLALFALALGLLAGRAVNAGVRWRVPGAAISLVFLALTAGLVLGGARANEESFTMDSTASQQEAARWISDNLPTDSTIIMDAYPWTDLRDPGFTGGETFQNAHYYFPALSDPSIRGGELHNNWRNIDYLAVSPSTEADIDRDFVPLLPEAANNSDELKTFSSGDWRIQIMRVRKVHQMRATEVPILSKTWTTYEEHFIQDGRVTDPKANGLTTSTGQANTLLRAVYMDDRETFDEVWRWTSENLQRGDGLLAGEYGGERSPKVTDMSSVTGADTDAALALLFASSRWDEPRYEREALRIMDGIWEQETVPISGGDRLVVAGSEYSPLQPVVNPSYFAPYAYRIFAEADPTHPWENLVDSSYGILEQIRQSQKLGGEVGLAPHLLLVNPYSGEVYPAEGEAAGEFSFDASRISWHIALDFLWFKDDRAREALEGLSFPRRELESEGRLFAAYNLDGSPATDHESVSMYAAVVPGLLVNGTQSLAHEVFAKQVFGAYTSGPGGSYWGGDPYNLYDQNMAWFATAVMDGSIGNLWVGEEFIDWEYLRASNSEDN